MESKSDDICMAYRDCSIGCGDFFGSVVCLQKRDMDDTACGAGAYMDQELEVELHESNIRMESVSNRGISGSGRFYHDYYKNQRCGEYGCTDGSVFVLCNAGYFDVTGAFAALSE